MPYGVIGKILNINLTNRASRPETLPDELYMRYLGGVGLGVRLLYDRIPAGADPLGPQNLLGFLSGALVGSGAPFAGRFLVVGKSPLTGGWGDANCGGNLAPAIKQCGYDGIFFEGAASEPVITVIHDDQVEILPAGELWGMDTIETEERLSAVYGPDARIACIGPAGENQVRFAAISNDRGRMAGRSGLGAVMGAKRLKALVLIGTGRIQAADPAAIDRRAKAVRALMPKGGSSLPAWAMSPIGWMMSRLPFKFHVDGLSSMPVMGEWGTTSGNELALISGDTPVRNWSGHPGMYPVRSIGIARFAGTQRQKYHCAACPLGCGRFSEAPNQGREVHRPEYETIAAFGPNLLNRDFNSLFDLSDACNRLGLDSISAGAVVGFAIECFENNLISADQASGSPPRWNDPAGALRLLDQIARRQGIGDLLAEGVKAAAERIGQGSERYAIHAGGQELPMHDPRIEPTYGVMYASDPTPGRHTVISTTLYDLFNLWTRVSWAPEPPATFPKKEMYLDGQDAALQRAAGAMYKAVLDCAGLCLIGAQIGVDRLEPFEMLNAALGFQKTPEDYMRIGAEIQALRQSFNVRHGLEPAAVTINLLAAGSPPAQRGPARGLSFDVYAMRRSFWKAMGWDEHTGHPPGED